jgi:hypothetical protein
MPHATADSIPTIRTLLLALIILGLLGMGLDLVLLEHYEDSWQLAPLFLISVALLAIVGYVTTRSAGSLRLLQVAMALLIVAGGLGVGLHYRGNLEFQLEMDPTASRWDLFTKVMHAKAPPALAPAAMAQLGLLGLIFSYRHPALQRSRERTFTHKQERAS